MKIGVPKEIKPQEHRIGLTPDSVKTLILEGHEVLIQNNGGFEAGFENDQYKSVGASIIDKAEDIFNDADIIVKVKEPQTGEVKMIRENQIVYTYLHLAAAKELTEGLIKSKGICIAYETVTDDNGRLPLLAPMLIYCSFSKPASKPPLFSIKTSCPSEIKVLTLSGVRPIRCS